MLKKIETKDLQPGARYSAPVFFDDGTNMLLPTGTEITNYELGILKEWKIKFVITAGTELAEGEEVEKISSLEEVEELDELDQIQETGNVEESYAIKGTKLTREELASVSPETISKLNKDKTTLELYDAYSNIILNLDKLFGKIKNRKKIEERPIDKYTKLIKALVKKAPSLCVSFVLDTKLDEDNLARTSINTAILAIILATELNLSDSDVDEIASAALLHDVGMMNVEEKILKKQEALTDVEKQAVAAHTSYGYKTALKELMYSESLALNIIQHHEKWDGTGMPNGIAGENITLGARIISVADAFVAMITPKPYRDLMLGYQAMKNILADNARRFDPAIVRLMIRSIGIYPIGSIALMNNASLARVIKTSPEAPMRPFIKILIDETGETLGEDSPVVDLKKNKNLFIVRAIDPRNYINA